MKAETTNTFTDFLTRKVYTVPKGQEKTMLFYRNRYVIAIMLGILLVSFNVPTPFSACLSLGFVLLGEVRYRFVFLKKCKPVPIAQIKQKDIAASSLLLNSGLYCLLGILLIYLAVMEPSVQTYQWFLGALGGIGVIVGVIYLIQFISQRRDQI